MSFETNLVTIYLDDRFNKIEGMRKVRANVTFTINGIESIPIEFVIRDRSSTLIMYDSAMVDLLNELDDEKEYEIGSATGTKYQEISVDCLTVDTIQYELFGLLESSYFLQFAEGLLDLDLEPIWQQNYVTTLRFQLLTFDSIL